MKKTSLTLSLLLMLLATNAWGEVKTLDCEIDEEYAKLYASIHPKVIPPFETPLLKEETVYKP